MAEKTLNDGDIVELPVLPLRDVVVFPNMVIPLFVGRQKSILALDTAMSADKKIFLAAQKEAGEDEPKVENIYDTGCIATVLQLLKLPDGTVKVLVEGVQRGKIIQYLAKEPYFLAQIQATATEVIPDREGEVLNRALMSEFEQYVKLNKKVPPELLTSLSGIDEPNRLTDSIAAHMSLKVDVKQKLLEQLDVGQRVEQLIGLMEGEIDILEVENRIRGRVKGQMEKSQRDYYLKEQLEAIKKEMGVLDEGPDELEKLDEKIKKLPAEAREKATSELKKLNAMPPMSAEATVSRNYLDALVTVPWSKKSKINKDLNKAQKVLDSDHYGLEEVKERIVEYIGVQQRVNKLKGPVLCLVGPPGVGKTSLGESIAAATGRKFTRVSLGGVRDEAEIRGHRRTYIGALPGKIIQRLTKAGVRNPLFLLDEIDKMAMDFRGDPASALLEVLDPEQNSAFNDHYLEVDYDLSDVMFICTANTLNIPDALLDRMEVIRLPGYTENEKVNIAKRYLIKKQLELHGLEKEEISISDGVIMDIIRYYTREAGVRNLERTIAKICRKVVKEILTKEKKPRVAITQRSLERYLGVKKFRYGIAEEKDRIGLVTGLAWTKVGGELLTIEGSSVFGKGKATYTGHLGEVMQESIQAAMTVVRSRAQLLGIMPDFYEKCDIHIHVPEGATPKDGPSAGIAMCTAIASVLTGIPVRSDVAMTGEITLRGEVLPIGGLKEKLLAANRGGIKTVVIPIENRRELKEIPENITDKLDIKAVRWIDEVLTIALQKMPTPLTDAQVESHMGKVLSQQNTNKKKTAKKKSSEDQRTH